MSSLTIVNLYHSQLLTGEKLHRLATYSWRTPFLCWSLDPADLFWYVLVPLLNEIVNSWVLANLSMSLNDFVDLCQIPSSASRLLLKKLAFITSCGNWSVSHYLVPFSESFIFVFSFLLLDKKGWNCIQYSRCSEPWTYAWSSCCHLLCLNS